MQETDDEVQDEYKYTTTDNRYMFDCEQVDWVNQQINHKTSMTHNALNQIENERENIEKDLKLLQAIKDERLRLENLMISFLEMKNELEEKLERSSSL